MKRPKLVPRKCKVCKDGFKVMKNSPQEFCSQICEKDPKFIQRLLAAGLDPKRYQPEEEEFDS